MGIQGGTYLDGEMHFPKLQDPGGGTYLDTWASGGGYLSGWGNGGEMSGKSKELLWRSVAWPCYSVAWPCDGVAWVLLQIGLAVWPGLGMASQIRRCQMQIGSQ